MIRFITLHKSFFDPINIRQSFVESVARFANMNILICIINCTILISGRDCRRNCIITPTISTDKIECRYIHLLDIIFRWQKKSSRYIFYPPTISFRWPSSVRTRTHTHSHSHSSNISNDF